ncbi:RDD family protein [Bacteroides sp. 214]|uniref:RDD family protein n=1 Tax=Bacteroides sp. 214 TaxID=2302935 RepID=UPI0013D80929|nr:RDD family protein [Bacteroides sp. 214]NDW12282.1 RDD family protein [Bacteroides sp. 214]
MADSTIITGQYVRINQVPASIGERIFARIVDYIILFLYVIATFFVLDKLYIGSYANTNVILTFILIYMPILFYSLLCEVFNNGQSIGKRLFNIRVVKVDGSIPTLSAYLLRWLLYLVDVPLTSGLGVIVVLITKNHQRLGDLAAGTMVIKERNYKKIHVSLDEFNFLSDNYKPVFPQAAELSLEQINVITKTLQAHGKERELHIQQLAGKVHKLLAIQTTPINQEQFLQTLVRDYQYFALQLI